MGCARSQRCRKPTPNRNGKQMAAKAKCDRRAIRGNCGISEPKRVDLRTERCVFTGNRRREKAEGKRDKDCEASNNPQHAEEIRISRADLFALQELVMEAHEGQRVSAKISRAKALVGFSRYRAAQEAARKKWDF